MNKLHKLFKPNSVAVIGASQKALRAGHVVMRNLLQSGFGGAIMPVTPRYKAVSGVIAYPDVASYPIRQILRFYVRTFHATSNCLKS